MTKIPINNVDDEGKEYLKRMSDPEYSKKIQEHIKRKDGICRKCNTHISHWMHKNRHCLFW